MSKTDLRVSDAERDRTATLLREHAGEGRLDLAELDERLERAYAARTRGDLAELTRDLPRVPARQRPREKRGEVGAYLAVMALLVAIWALTGMGYFWPVWPALGWGFALLMSSAACGRQRRPHRQRFI
jgi:Domain of unknown function (DUF1707)/2TM domain